jgi:wyosine [tRNA(Phe)-imidazoG37] synthetase (radical SAM superfamily)
MNYLYGPLTSRRLGCSLGVSITPHKICNFDCVYCQLGATARHTTQRAAYVPIEQVLEELAAWCAAHREEERKLTYITFSGTGEPTLHAGLGELIRRIKLITKVPVAVLTNAGLLTDPAVRKELKDADLLVPSLDAATQSAFERVDRPAPGIKVAQIIEGLVALRKEYAGTLWLEVVLVKGLNDAPADLEALREAVARIKPDKVQLNSPVRVTAESNVCVADRATLERVQREIGFPCEIV